MITNESKHEGESGLSNTLTLLANDQRRATLRSLEQADEPVLDVEELADRVAGRVEPTGSAAGHRERVHAMLVHNHLPRLEDGGLVSYDSFSGNVRRRKDECLDELLEVIDGVDAVDPVE